MKNVSDRESGLEQYLNSALGETIWSAITGPRGDYVLSLQLGEKRRRSARLANPRLSFLQRTYEGSIGFLIECPWRLDGPNGVVLSCLSILDRPDPPTSDEILQFVGLKLESFHLDGVPWDLKLVFFGGHTLHCFCAETVPFEPVKPRAHVVSEQEIRQRIRRSTRNNWSFWNTDGFLVVGPSGRILRPKATPLEAMRRQLREIMDTDDAELD